MLNMDVAWFYFLIVLISATFANFTIRQKMSTAQDDEKKAAKVECVLLPLQLVKTFDVAKLWKYDARIFSVFVKKRQSLLLSSSAETEHVVVEAMWPASRLKKTNELSRKLEYFASPISAATRTATSKDIDTGRATLISLDRDGVSQWIRRNTVGVSKFILECEMGKLPTNYLDMLPEDFAAWLDVKAAAIAQQLECNKRAYTDFLAAKTIISPGTITAAGTILDAATVGEQGDEKSSKRHKIQTSSLILD